MASLYPTLEDMKVDQIQKAQISAAQDFMSQQQQQPQQDAYGNPAAGYGSAVPSNLATNYPSLMEEYMGLRLEPPSGPIVPVASQQVAVPAASGTVTTYGGSMMVAPLTGDNNVGLLRAQVTHGIREVIVCKDAEGKVGLKLRDVNKGVFIQFVAKASPAALAGLRFGDQILQIDGENVAGYSGEKAMKIFSKANPKRIVLAVRDRPFERTITLHKDSAGRVGFQYKDGKVISLVKDSSAARNGLLTDHQILEVNGQNVIGMKDKDIGNIVEGSGQTITLTIMPSIIFDHMVKCMADGLIKKLMDHSVPEYY